MNTKIAKALCDAEVIKFGEFTMVSGRKSPVYIDMRVLPSFPSSFNIVVEELAKIVKKLGVKVVAGAETAGIPLAAGIALKSNMPMVYVRKSPKRYGTMSMIEGVIKKGDKVALVDDIATDGKSKIRFIDGIRVADGKVNDVIIVLDREQGTKDTLAEVDAELHSLITLRELLDYMKDNELVDEQKYEDVIAYLDENK